MSMDVEKLIDLEVLSVEITDDNRVLKFIPVAGNPLYLVATGECCSDSWFDHIYFNEEPSGRIIDVKTIELGEVLASLQESDTIYGLELVFQSSDGLYKTRLQIEMRNSSNGYYGGEFRVYKTQPPLFEGITFTPLKETF